jgi:small conductance mechanosensitive channel
MDQGFTAQLDELARLYVIPALWKVAGAVMIWLVGRWAVRALRAALRRFMRIRRLDTTLAIYVDTGASVVLQLLVLIAVLGVLGVETTSFAALLAAAGIAIGAAWSGLLSHFAAGLFLLTFRPFKVGDSISAAGVTGRVREIGLFVTTIDTADNVVTFVGNNKLFSDNLQNLSANPFRRVDLTASLPSTVDVAGTMVRLRERLRAIPNVLPEPEPLVQILALNPGSVAVTVRPFCRPDDYWQVFFDANRAIVEVVGEGERRQEVADRRFG